MGQIVGGAAKPKRCNLNKLSQLGTPAAGEYILVSSDNSMNAAGQGNFDCYIEGDGRTAATALKLKSVVDDIFDISSYHATDGVLAKYADLAAALGTNGANIPEGIRKGGMSVKFVQSSDNKYVQYRLMSDTFSTTESDWQGVDNVLVAGSENLVKSGVVSDFIIKGGTQNYALINNEYVRQDGIVEAYSGWSRTPLLYVKGISTLEYTATLNSSYNVAYDEDGNKLFSFTVYEGHNSQPLVLPSGKEVVWCILSNTTSAMKSLVLHNLPKIDILSDINKLKDKLPTIEERIADVEDAVLVSSILSEEDFELQQPYEIYQDGTIHKGSSSQQLFSYVIPNGYSVSALHVKAQAWNTYPVVAFYNGDNYLSGDSVICGNTNIDTDVSVPKNATKICVVNYPLRYSSPSIQMTVASGVNKKVEELDDRVTAIEEGGVNSNSILSLNPKSEYEDKIIQLTGKFGNGRNASIPEPIVLAWFSDLHRDVENLKRIKQYTDEYIGYLTNIISTGDNQNYIQDYSFWNENGASGFLNVLGNHDAWAYLSEVDESMTEGPYQGSALYLIKPKLCYDKYFAPYIGNWGVVQPEGAAEQGKCYYYKDYTYNNIVTLRLIVLDCMHYNIYSDLDSNNNSIQMAWFESVLNDAKTNSIPVVVAAHYKATTVNKIDCAFNSDDYSSEDSMPLAKEKVDNFINAGGEFVCWLHGHDHFDMTGTVAPNNFLSLGIDTARCPDVWADEKRVVGTKSQDCFNFIAIDTYEKLVKIIRIGSSYRRNLQHKGILVYRYANYNGNQKGLVLCE